MKKKKSYIGSGPELDNLPWYNTERLGGGTKGHSGCFIWLLIIATAIVIICTIKYLPK